MRRELLAWGLLVCADLPLPSLAPTVAALLKALTKEKDDAAMTRYISEAVVLLLCRSGDRSRAAASTAQLSDYYENIPFAHLLETGWLAQQLAATDASSTSSSAQLFRHRFVSSLCRVLSRLLPDAAADVCRASADIVLHGTFSSSTTCKL